VQTVHPQVSIPSEKNKNIETYIKIENNNKSRIIEQHFKLLRLILFESPTVKY